MRFSSLKDHILNTELPYFQTPGWCTENESGGVRGFPDRRPVGSRGGGGVRRVSGLPHRHRLQVASVLDRLLESPEEPAVRGEEMVHQLIEWGALHEVLVHGFPISPPSPDLPRTPPGFPDQRVKVTEDHRLLRLRVLGTLFL